MNERIQKLLGFLATNPTDSFIIHALALEYVKIQDVAVAASYFKKNIEIAPLYIATYYHYGKLLEANGDETSAIAMYKDGMEKALEVKDQHAYSELRSVYEELTF